MLKLAIFSGFVNISSETFLEKLSTLNELQNYALAIDEENYAVYENIRVTRLLLFDDWPHFFFFYGQSEAGNSNASKTGLVRLSAEGLVSILQ